MKFSRWMLAAAAAGLPLAAEARSPENARAERQMFEQASELWSLKVRAAATQEERRELWEKKPSARAHAQRLWTMIQGSLDQEWTIEPAAWMILSAPDGREEVEAVRAALETHHLQSARLAPLCWALTAVPDPRTLALLENVVKSNPHPPVRGSAALSVSVLLEGLGDGPEIMKRRLTLLRQAIIDSADVDLGGVTVAQVAQDELFVIANLTKGRVAPEIEGTDVAGKPLKLSDARGKVVVLLFWATWNDQAEKTLDLTRSLAERLAGRNFEVIGVNADARDTLRGMHADRTVTWRNFSDPEQKIASLYRIKDWPVAYVLDAEGRIQFIGAPGTFVDLAAESLLEG